MANPYREQVIALVKANPYAFTYQDVAVKFNISSETVRNIARGTPEIFNLFKKTSTNLNGIIKPDSTLKGDKMKKSKQTITTEARLEARLRDVGNQKGETEKKYKALLDENTRLQKALDAALCITDHKPKLFSIKAPKEQRNGHATAIALLSDVHCEEVVPAHKVNGLNEHNPEISKQRVAKFFELVTKFIRVDRQESSVNNLVLWLGGDFFTNNAHDAPVAMPSVIAAMFAEDMIASGIQYLLDQEPGLNIHIVGSVGNHSRQFTQKPVNQALEQEQSFEWMMYHHLRSYFSKEKRVTWTLDNSYLTYIQVYNKTIRFCHGHLGWRYNDGLGGVHGPLWKVISQKWDKQKQADLTCCGHYHTLTPASLARPYIVNGSTIGVTPYGMSFGFEEPAQMYFLVHDKYGIVNQRPLFVAR